MINYDIVSSPFHWSTGPGSKLEYTGDRKTCVACGVSVYRDKGKNKDHHIRGAHRFCMKCIKPYDKIYGKNPVLTKKKTAVTKK